MGRAKEIELLIVLNGIEIGKEYGKIIGGFNF